MIITMTSKFGQRLQHTCELDCTEAQLATWRAGTYIQTALPHLTVEEREFLMTGTTPDEWLAAFGPEEGDEGRTWRADPVFTGNGGFLAYRASTSDEECGDCVVVESPAHCSREPLPEGQTRLVWGTYEGASGGRVTDGLFHAALTEVLPSHAMAVARARASTVGR